MPRARAAQRPADRPAQSASRSHEQRLHALLEVATPHEAEALQELLDGHRQPVQLVRELHDIATGKHKIRGNTTRQLADARCVMRAVAEMAANDVAFEARLFRGYVRQVADRRPEPLSREEQHAAAIAAEAERQAKLLTPVERPRTPEEIAATAPRRTDWRRMLHEGSGAPVRVGALLERAVARVAHA